MRYSPRLIADAMLGGLAKWLRMLGYDTAYVRDIEDSELIRVAALEQRTIITRDTGLAAKKKNVACLLIRSNDTPGQLREALGNLFSGGSRPCFGQPRCTECNGELSPSDRANVSAYVPEHVLLNFNSFFRCGSCGKVYWEGSHKRLIDEKIRGVLAGLGFNWENSGTS